MQSLQFAAPTSLAEAAALLGGSDNPKVLAGGTDLLVQMKLGLREPALVVDIKRIPELGEVSLGADGLRLGAAVPGAEVTANADIAALYPGFVEALGLIGSTQVQGRCSPGGNLCNSSPAADSVPAMIACGAQCNIYGPNGMRSVPVEAFNTGPGRNCLAADEILVSLEFPRPAARSADAYLRFIPRTEMDIAVAGAAVALTLDDAGVCTAARVAIGAVAPTALLVPAAAEALVGSKLDDAALAAVAEAASAAANPISDKRGTAEYRRKVVGVLARRAALIAQSRAQAEE
ncbi:xanthine dehydrogenase family protein subunit M [Mangrovimicrobium sediminis]|uniref:Xanthine dehydrogenase family protein subunit M n=1 Tax=Mangrovimicrobium sediminis TaxID=2562682 RepID=A0A4Z0M739_9GAMM|nr:xanthine dehydrogenase family protein subunit M [Haliea sp. SAOS-164]TGD75482.1 xanthine dehydrogenase family protein subunit M [Haliea sp. SAOS-164]